MAGRESAKAARGKYKIPDMSIASTNAADPAEFSADDLPIYRAVSRSAIVSLVLGVFGFLGMFVAPGLIIPLVGLIVGGVAIHTIRSYPAEYSGLPIALVGAAVNALFLLLGAQYHIADAMTAVPEGYKAITFANLQPNPESLEDQYLVPKQARELSGERVFIRGYIHPAVSGFGKVDHFLMVEDMKICCFGGDPDKSTTMIEVHIKGDAPRVKYSTRSVYIGGKFVAAVHPGKFGKIKTPVIYHLEADYVKH